MENQRLGVARGIIEVAVSPLLQGLKAVQQMSVQTGKALEKIGESADRSFARAKSAAEQFDRTPLGKLHQGLTSIQGTLAAISVAAGAFTTMGVQAARSVVQTENQFRVLLGSQQLASREMARLTELAKDLKAPIGETLEAAAGMIPLVKSTGAEFGKLVTITEKLARIDPFQGRQGARIALQEFMSGDITSIFRRFELGVAKDTYRQIVDESGGDANKMLDGLEQVLDKTGLTTEALRELNAADPFPRLADTLQRAMSTAFRPFFEKVLIPLAEGFVNFVETLNQTNPELLAFGGAIVAAVAVGAPMLVFLNQAIAGFKALKVAMAATGAGGAMSGIAKGGIAIAGGVMVGAGIAQGMADSGMRSGDLGRIAEGEGPMDILGERLKQILVIVVDGFLHFAKVLALGVLFIKNAIEQVVNVFKLGGATLGVAFNQIIESFGKLISGIGSMMGFLPGAGELMKAGLNIQTGAREGIRTSAEEGQRVAGELSRGFSVRQSELDHVDRNMAAVRDSVLGGLANFLFPVQQAAESTAEELADVGHTVAEALGDTPEYLAEQAKELSEVYGEYLEATKSAESEYLQERQKAEQDYLDQVIEIAEEAVKARDRALRELAERQSKLALELGRDEQDAAREAADKRLDMQIDAARAERDAYQGHLEKLEGIRAKAQADEEQSLLDLDFRAVFEGRRKAADEVEQEVSRFAQSRGEYNQKLADQEADLQLSMERERQERLIKYERDQADLRMAHEAELAQILQQRNEKLAQAHNEHAERLQVMAQGHASEMSMLAQQAQERLTLISKTEAERNAIVAKAQADLVAQARNFLAMRTGSPVGGPAASNAPHQGPAPRPTNPAPSNPFSLAQQLGLRAPALPRPGMPVATRATGGPLAAFQTSLVNEGFRGQMERFVSGGQSYMLPGGVGLFTPLAAGNVDAGGGASLNLTVNINGASFGANVTPQDVVAVARAELMKAVEELGRR